MTRSYAAILDKRLREQPGDVPRVLERVSTLDGFINANINAQVQGYLILRDYKEGSVAKKGDLRFQIDPRPFEAGDLQH